jgi:hypothetical protein
MEQGRIPVGDIGRSESDTDEKEKFGNAVMYQWRKM